MHFIFILEYQCISSATFCCRGSHSRGANLHKTLESDYILWVYDNYIVIQDYIVEGLDSNASVELRKS